MILLFYNFNFLDCFSDSDIDFSKKNYLTSVNSPMQQLNNYGSLNDPGNFPVDNYMTKYGDPKPISTERGLVPTLEDEFPLKAESLNGFRPLSGEYTPLNSQNTAMRSLRGPGIERQNHVPSIRGKLPVQSLVNPESFVGYERENEIPPANNDIHLEDEYNDNFNFYDFNHRKKNTLLRPEVLDYMERTSDFRFLDHELKHFLRNESARRAELDQRAQEHEDRENHLLQFENDMEDDFNRTAHEKFDIGAQEEKIDCSDLSQHDRMKTIFMDFLFDKVNDFRA